MKGLIVLISSSLLFLTMPSANAGKSPTLIKTNEIPRNWCGTFRWLGEADLQKMGIRITEIRKLSGGRLEGRGTGLTRSGGRRFQMSVVIVINPATARFTYQESRPIPDSPEFTTDGKAVGKIATNLRSASAVWTQNKTGDQGDLVLKARPPGTPLDQDCPRPGV